MEPNAGHAPLRWGQNSGEHDEITFDIAAQIGALFKTNGIDSPTHSLRVRHVFEAGFSQHGVLTFTQADVFNVVERLRSGGPVYDGYIPGGTTGPSNIDFGLTAAGTLPAGDPRHQMQPRDVPVIQINTETEEATLASSGLTYRRPDSDALGDRYRLWEVPGASHVSNDLNTASVTLQADLAELQRIPVAALGSVGCAHLQFVKGPLVGVHGVVDLNTYPFSNVANAAFADLTTWINEGVPPPHASPIEVSNTVPATIVRDRFGNAPRGVRTPFVDVPTATYSPTDTVAHTTTFSGFCSLYGYNKPFSHSTLRSLYRSHEAYVDAVAGESNLLVREGFWLRADAQQVIIQAALADVP